MQQIENPFTDADRLLDESSEPLPPVRLVDFHCELTSEKNALRALPRRARQRGRRARTRTSSTGDERILPKGTAYQTDLGMTGPIWSVIGFEPRDRPAALHQRAADPLRGGRRGRSSSTPCQVDIDPATGRALQIERIQRLARGRSAWPTPRRRRHDPLPPGRAGRRRPPGPSTVDLHTHTTRSDGVVAPGELVRRRRATPASGSSRSPTTTRSPATARSSPRARVPPGLTLIPGVEINAHRDPRPRAVGGRAAHPRVRHGPGRRGVRGRARRRSATAAASGSRGPSTGCASSGCPIDAQVAGARRATDDDALGRPTIARALDRRRARRERRGRLQPAARARGSPPTCRARASARSRRSRPSAAAGGLAVARPLPRGADAASTSCASSSTPGLGGLEVYYRSFDAGDGRGGRRPWRRRCGLVRDRRHRLPRRPRTVRRGARRPVGPARGRRRAPGPAMGLGSS